jgi:hypothetical protein
MKAHGVSRGINRQRDEARFSGRKMKAHGVSRGINRQRDEARFSGRKMKAHGRKPWDQSSAW